MTVKKFENIIKKELVFKSADFNKQLKKNVENLLSLMTYQDDTQLTLLALEMAVSFNKAFAEGFVEAEDKYEVYG